ncbi:suppressor of tub2 mutation [Peltigera leucophlebia]|nr:suppressor of tub2 mutation [Peltigera leucophlebia]
MAANSDQIEPLYTETARDLEDSFRDMQPCFEGKEVEGNWSAREKNILKLRRITKGNSPMDFTVAYLVGIKTLLDGILKAVNSLRTTVSSNGCLLVQDIANAAGSGLDSMVDIILQSLIKLCANTKKITASNADVTVNAIVTNVTYSARLAHHIWLACQDKNVQPRSFATGWIKTILHRHRHHKNILEHAGSLELIEKCLKAGLADRDIKVRESMRVTLWSFARLWPDRSEVVISALDDKYQKSILNDPANPIKSKALEASAASTDSKVHPLSRSTTSVPKPTIRETIAAQKRAKMASKNLPERPGSAQSAAPLQHFSTSSGTTRPATALASAMGTLSSAPVRPMRPARRPEIKKVPTADPHSAKGISKIALNKPLEDNHHSPLSGKKNSQFGAKRALAASAAKENVIPTVRRNERHALRETSPQSGTIASGAKIAAQKLTTSEIGKPGSDGLPMRGRSTSIKSTSGETRPTWSPPGSVKSPNSTPAGSRRSSLCLSESGRLTSKSPPKREPQTPPREEHEMAPTPLHFEQGTALILRKGEVEAAQIHHPAEQEISQTPPEVEDETAQITHEADQETAQISQQDELQTAQTLPEVEHQEEIAQDHPQAEQVTVQILSAVGDEPAEIPTEAEKSTAGNIRATSVMKETNAKLRVYEDPSGEGLDITIAPPSARPSAKLKVLEELPINEPAAYQPPRIGPLLAEETDKSGYHKDWKEQVKVEGRSIGDKNDNPYLMRRILASGITRLRAGTLDVHGFRRLQGLIRDREDVWEGGAKFDELLELLLETLESPNRNDSIATNARAQDQLKAQVLMTIRLLLRREVKYLSTYYARALTALISARKHHASTSHIVSGLEEVSELIVEKCEPIECIEAVLDLLETDILRTYQTIYMALYILAGLLQRMYPQNRPVSHLSVTNIIPPHTETKPEHHDQRQRQQSPSSASRTRRVRSTSPSKSRISHSQKVRLGQTAAHFLSDTNPEIRRAGVEFTLKLYDAVGEEGGFWDLMETNSDQRNLITYYLLRRDRS